MEFAWNTFRRQNRNLNKNSKSNSKYSKNSLTTELFTIGTGCFIRKQALQATGVHRRRTSIRFINFLICIFCNRSSERGLLCGEGEINENDGGISHLNRIGFKRRHFTFHSSGLNCVMIA